MAISDKLEYLNDTKTLLKQKINNLGGSITDETTFREYANQLQNVYDNLPKTSYQTGTEITLSPTLKGKLDYDSGKVGYGDTSQDSTTGKNLLPPTEDFTSTSDGVTIKGEKGIYEFSGSSVTSAKMVDKAVITPYEIKANDYLHVKNDATDTNCTFNFVFSDNSSTNLQAFNTTDKKFALTSYVGKTISKIRLYTGANYGGTKIIMTPMIVNNVSTTTDYEQYTGGIPSPNPLYPQPIKNVTGDNEVVVNSKNLFNYATDFKGSPSLSNYITNNNDGTFTTTGTTGLPHAVTKTLSAGTYTISIQAVEGYSLDNMYVRVANTSGNTTSYTFTLAETTEVIFDIRTQTSIVKFYIQIEKSSTATDYTLYQNQTLPLNLGTIELNKIGDYQDYIYKNNGKWYKHEEIEKIASYNGETITTDYMSTTGQLTTGATVYYGKTATDIEITDTTLINQLEAISNANSYNGTTYITSSGSLPMIIKARALKGE